MFTESDPERQIDLTDPGSIWRLLVDTVNEMVAAFVAQLPLILIGAIFFFAGYVVIRLLMPSIDRALRRTDLDTSLRKLARATIRFTLTFILLLLSLSLAGVDVGTAFAALGIGGLALAFALQNILENFVAGLLILLRRPFLIGDLIVTNGYEGVVEDIRMRTTRLIAVDGEKVLVPNADVFRNPLMNLTDRGMRRTRLAVGIDYRDDHDAAREVLSRFLPTVDGVMSEPEPEVLIRALGDSSVEFELRYWTLPANSDVARARDRVLSAAKRAVEEAGMTIPWPIRTLVVDGGAVTVRQED